MSEKKRILIKNIGKNGSFTIRVKKIKHEDNDSLSDVVSRVVSRKLKRESTKAA